MNIVLNALREKFIMGDKLYQDCVSVDFLKFVLQLFEADKLDCKKFIMRGQEQIIVLNEVKSFQSWQD